jgi:acetyl-CoA synthetase
MSEAPEKYELRAEIAHLACPRRPTDKPADLWVAAIDALRRERASPADYRAVWGKLFGVADAARASAAPLWFPDDEALRHSNVAGWSAELGLKSPDQFHRWSVEHRGEYWDQAARRLGIVFDQPATRILDVANGPDRAVWFPGARLNIVTSCFQAPAEQPAVVSQMPGQPIERLSYAELRRLTNRVSNSIRQGGWRPGDRLAVVLPMTAWSVPIYLGIVQAGCAVVSIADSFAPEEIANRIRIADAQAVFTYDRLVRSGKSFPLYERVCQATDRPVVVLPVDRSRVSAELRVKDRPWHEFLDSRDQFVPDSAESQSCINVLFSSGTTGDPKAIVWNHLTGLKCAADGYVHQDLRPGHVAVWPTNLGWMMGPWLIFATLINRGTIGLYEDAPLGSEFGQFVQDARVNMLGVVPTIVKAWRGTGCMESFDWSAIHTFSSTGESSHPEDMFYLASLAGIRPIIEYCGGTEIGGGYITSLITKPNHVAAFNSPAAGLDFAILDEDGRAADQGELFLIPPSVGLSDQLLNRDHHATYYADTPRGPHLPVLRRHGDHFRRIGADVFVAGGRVDDTMNLGGIKVSSAELERVCNRVAGVKETAAVSVAEEHGPEQLVVFAVVDQPTLSSSALLQSLNHALRDHLNPLFKVSRVILIESLPRTASNKVMRRLLRSQLK